MPVPHLAGSWQVITPPDMDQPWLVSRDFALAMLNGYGPTPPFAVWAGGDVRVRHRGWRRARGRGGVSAPDRLGDPRLIHDVLQRLPDVELPDHETHLRVVEVRLSVLDAVGVERLQRPAAAQRVGRRDRRAGGLGRKVLGGNVAHIDRPGLQRRVLRRVTGERHQLDRRQLRLRAPGVGRVGHHRHVAVGAEGGQLPRPVHHLPQRAGGIAAGLLGLGRQERVDGLALGPAVGGGVRRCNRRCPAWRPAW